MPGFVAYPYLDDPFDDIDNQDKYLLQSTSKFYFNNLIYSTNHISFNNFVQQNCDDYLHNHLLYDNMYIFNQYALYIFTIQENSTNAFDKQYHKHIETSFDQPRYTKFVHTYISRLSGSLSLLTRCYRRARLCLEYLNHIDKVWALNHYACNLLVYHAIIELYYSKIWRGVMTLRGAWIITWSPIHYIYGLINGENTGSLLSALVDRLNKIGGLLAQIKDLNGFMKHKLDIGVTIIRSYVGKGYEEINSIKSSITYLVSYMEPMGNILRYIEEKIGSGRCLSITIDDLGWEKKYLECSRSVKIAISNLKYIQGYIDNSFHTIDLIESSVKILKRYISVLENVNIELGPLIFRAMYIRIRLRQTCEEVESFRENYLSFSKLLLGTLIIYNQGNVGQEHITTKDQIEAIPGIIEAYIKVGDGLISKLSNVYFHNKHNINQLKVFTGLIEFSIGKIGSVITCFNVSNKQNIKNLELWFKYILKQFTGSSLTSTIKFLKDKKNITHSGGNMLSDSIKTTTQGKPVSTYTNHTGELVWPMFLHMSMMEPENVLFKLYECHKSKEKMKEMLSALSCLCLFNFRFKDKPSYRKELVSYQREGDPLDVSNGSNDTNHVCVCLVMRYHVYPKFMECISLVFNIIRDLSSCSGRNFDKHSRRYTIDIHKSKLALFLIETVYKIWILIQSRYLAEIVYTYKVFKCFCGFPNDSYYSYFICIMIYVSYLLQKVSTPEENFELNIQHIMGLLSDLETNDIIIGKKTSYPERQTISTSQNSEMETKPLVNIKFKPSATIRTYYYMTSGTRYSNQTNLTFRDQSIPVDDQLRTAHKLRLSIQYNVVRREQFEVTVSFPFTNTRQAYSKIKELAESVCSTCVWESNATRNVRACNICQPCAVLKQPLIFFHKNIESTLIQISDNSILSFLVELEYRFPEIKILYYVMERIVNDCKTITIMSKNNRIVDSTSVINKKGFEGVSNNNYTYNDAYRINTSRAHGILIFPVHYCTLGPLCSTIFLLILLYYWLWIHLNISGNK